MSHIAERLKQLDITIPHPPEPVGYYLPVLRTGNLVVTSGQLPVIGKELMFAGKLGHDLHEEEGANAARLCAINALAQIQHCLGSLDQVTRVVRVEGYVNSAANFHNQPQVLNGASKLLVDVFGEIGKHTRMAVGVAELPLNAAVEVCVWVEA